MAHSIYYAFVLLYLGPVIHSFVLGFSEPEQCGSVRVAWAQRSDPAEQFQYPFNLFIVPFNSTAIVYTIDSWNESTLSGSALFGFPLPASSPYILGVVDSQGRGVGSSSEILTVRDSNNTSCLSSRPQQLAQLQTYSVSPSQDCPAIDLSFDPARLARTISFSPGEPPLDLRKFSTTTRSGFTRIPGFTSLSRAVVVYQLNESTPAYTSSLIDTGGAESTSCIDALPSTSQPPPALKGGSVIGYVLAAVVVTGVVTSLVVYVYNLRVLAWKPPCPPPKDRLLFIHRRSASSQHTDLEAARLIPLPPSTASLSTPRMEMRGSVASFAVPDPPQSTPVSQNASPSASNYERINENAHPPAFNQSTVAASPTTSPPNDHLSASSSRHHSVGEKDMSQTPHKARQRQSDVSSYLHSTRPSTFVSSTRESMMLERFEEMTNPHFAPRPDSPTLPEIPLTSPFRINIELQRLSKSSSKKSEKRSLYRKMEDDEGSSEELKLDRRSRSLSRTKSSSSINSRKSRKKTRSVPQ